MDAPPGPSSPWRMSHDRAPAASSVSQARAVNTDAADTYHQPDRVDQQMLTQHSSGSGAAAAVIGSPQSSHHQSHCSTQQQQMLLQQQQQQQHLHHQIQNQQPNGTHHPQLHAQPPSKLNERHMSPYPPICSSDVAPCASMKLRELCFAFQQDHDARVLAMQKMRKPSSRPPSLDDDVVHAQEGFAEQQAKENNDASSSAMHLTHATPPSTGKRVFTELDLSEASHTAPGRTTSVSPSPSQRHCSPPSSLKDGSDHTSTASSPLSPFSIVMRRSSLFTEPDGYKLQLSKSMCDATAAMGPLPDDRWTLELSASSAHGEDDLGKREKGSTLLLSPSQSPASRPPKVRRISGLSDSVQSSPAVRRKEPPQIAPFYFPNGKDGDERERREMSFLKTFLETQRASHANQSAPLVTGTVSGTTNSNVVRMGSMSRTGSVDESVATSMDTSHPHGGSGTAANTISGSALDGFGASHQGVNSNTFAMDHIHSTGLPAQLPASLPPHPHLSLGSVEGAQLHIFWPDFVGLVVSVAGLPSFLSKMIFNRLQEAANCAGMTHIPQEAFVSFYMESCMGLRPAQRLVRTLLNGANRSFLIRSDFEAMLSALLGTHPGLLFLQHTPEFQHRYAETVIERIFYNLSSSPHANRLVLRDVEQHKFLETLLEVDVSEDINRERRYFSYEHFYVLYCRFWELDTDHDLMLSKADLLRYGQHSLTSIIVDRVFSGAGRPRLWKDKDTLSYIDFIWFCLSEEDKTSRTAITYWFHCLDLDGDGALSLYELEEFYKEQVHRMECLGHEPIALRDVVCQILDMLNKPMAKEPVIHVQDLIRSKLSANFFNLMFNLSKLFMLEARDPLTIRNEHVTPELTPWDRFAAVEYLRLSSEEEDVDQGEAQGQSQESAAHLGIENETNGDAQPTHQQLQQHEQDQQQASSAGQMLPQDPAEQGGEHQEHDASHLPLRPQSSEPQQQQHEHHLPQDAVEELVGSQRWLM
ncbi:putative serine/threonine protein phosphatase 2A regulatory subunit B''gamma [Porphyridium purpureum]|uniref:Putative serine/threonine protein phosphatase 2A regulatory subunit B''gamma n=1 Tax=Porphyridium purpureum TaxID=35688 RepID=A0A5J4YTJ3_PORPP|nr:putative serine/threonine protein phosphatase 2A regulatory subunit B''gamma [Porphyridium purpureum]|eukprot:POR8175..scf236_6